MKIFILQVQPKLQPQSQTFIYPKHNSDTGVEQDFFSFLNQNKDLLTNSPDRADWHYLPVYWTRWHLNHDYGKTGREELQHEIDKTIINDGKTFTICQYDDGPLANIGKSVQCLASRKTSEGIDIPLLSTPHRKPLFHRKKKYLASFVGRLTTHPVRKLMANALKHHNNVFIYDGDCGSKFFVKMTVASYISLSPRGYGGSSFRFFESMQLGVVPFLIGDIDTRPFKKYIKWDECSLFSSDTDAILKILSTYSTGELRHMSNLAAQIYSNKLRFGKWCDLLIKELGELT